MLAQKEDRPALEVRDQELKAITAVRVWLVITERPQPSAAVALAICVDLTLVATLVPMVAMKVVTEPMVVAEAAEAVVPA